MSVLHRIQSTAKENAEHRAQIKMIMSLYDDTDSEDYFNYESCI